MMFKQLNVRTDVGANPTIHLRADDIEVRYTKGGAAYVATVDLNVNPPVVRKREKCGYCRQMIPFDGGYIRVFGRAIAVKM